MLPRQGAASTGTVLRCSCPGPGLSSFVPPGWGLSRPAGASPSRGSLPFLSQLCLAPAAWPDSALPFPRSGPSRSRPGPALTSLSPQTIDQFEYDGCDNCDAYLQMKGNREMVYDCTSSSFDG